MTCKKLCSLSTQSIEKKRKKTALYVCQYCLEKDWSEYDTYIFLAWLQLSDYCKRWSFWINEMKNNH